MTNRNFPPNIKEELLNAVKDYFLWKWCNSETGTFKCKVYKSIVFRMWKLAL